MEEDFLRVSTNFSFDAERVFRAFTTEAELEEWFQPFIDFTVPLQVSLEMEEGGVFSMIFEDEDGAEHTLIGEFIEIVPEESLVFEWQWEENEPLGDTTVTIQFVGEDGRTEVIITQEGLLDDEQRSRYQEGWLQSMENLERMLELV